MTRIERLVENSPLSINCLPIRVSRAHLRPHLPFRAAICQNACPQVRH
jgi:hypothetical protein